MKKTPDTCESAGNPLRCLPVYLILTLLLAALLPTGCLTPFQALRFGGNRRPVYTFAIYSLAREEMLGSRLSKQLPALTGKSVCVRTIPLISSAVVVSARTRNLEDGKTSVIAQLDTHGRMLWTQASSEFSGRNAALAVDGIYQFPVKIEAAPGSHRIVLEGPWSRQLARNVAQNATANYKILN